MYGSPEHNNEIESQIAEVIYKVFGGRSGKVGVGAYCPDCCTQDGKLSIWYSKDGSPSSGGHHSLTLPMRVPEKNLFPSEAMLHFMGQAPLPTKRAKPRDWIEMAEEFAKEVKAKYDAK